MYLIEILNLKQFDGTDQIRIHRIVEQTVHQIIQCLEEDICSIWMSFCTLYLNK